MVRWFLKRLKKCVRSGFSNDFRHVCAVVFKTTLEIVFGPKLGVIFGVNLGVIFGVIFGVNLVKLGSFLGHFWAHFWGHFWGQFGVNLGSFWEHFWVHFWGQFGFIFWGRAITFHLNKWQPNCIKEHDGAEHTNF